eukprot:m.114382 g.114382  ORF g.114382 m.114382 type:complete len:524 (-) comp28345_c0_seq2:34-1605(-)
MSSTSQPATKKAKTECVHSPIPAQFQLTIKPSITEPYPVKMSMHRELRANVVQRFKALAKDAPAGSILLAQGSAQQMRDDSDHEPNFRQESNFHYLFGAREPGGYGIIDVDTGRTTLFMARLPEEYQKWMGMHKSAADLKAMYETEDVKFDDELVAHLDGLAVKPTIYVIDGTNTDSGSNFKTPSFEGMSKYTVHKSSEFFNAIMNARIRKTEEELELMRHVNIVSSEAHMAVMQHCQPGVKEFQLESLFLHWCYYNGGARFQAYTCICGSGPNGAALHYGHAGAPNDRVHKDGDMCLHDMGGEFHCYTSDITNSFPSNGKFTDDQKMVYEAVLAANWGVMDKMKAGVDWVTMHEHAYRCILTRLEQGGLVVGDVEDMMAANLGSVFMPHGLGHFMGKDTHDVGGYLDTMPPRPKLDGFKSLRTACILEPNMVITVEPGCYFIDYCLDKALADPAQEKFLNKDMLQKFRGFGGCRLEDDVIVTETGIENLTWAPRTVADVEAVCQGKIVDRFSFERKGIVNNC